MKRGRCISADTLFAERIVCPSPARVLAEGAEGDRFSLIVAETYRDRYLGNGFLSINL